MKRNILIALLTAAGITSQAQETTTPLPKMYGKEIGLFAQQNFSSGSGNDKIIMAGAQFKKWQTPHYGFRVLVSFGNYSDYDRFYSNHYRVTAPDTILEKYNSTDINMGIIGFGAEAQRVFYKRIVLFAAIEIRGGYGTGRQEENTVTTYNTQNEQYQNYRVTSSKDASIIYIGAAPTIGAKVQFKRINFGLEATGVNMEYKSIKAENTLYGRYGTSDFSLGDITQRLFVGFQF